MMHGLIEILAVVSGFIIRRLCFCRHTSVEYKSDEGKSAQCGQFFNPPDVRVVCGLR
jgi:hypothetical protein